MYLLNLAGEFAVVVLMKIIARPRAWVLSVLIALIAIFVSAGTAAAVPALLKVKAGTANFCLDPRAQTAFDDAGISMSAGAPAQLITTGPQPCVTTHVTEGAVSLGLTGGDFPFRGTITFTRAVDNTQITFSDIAVTFAVPSTVTAVVNGNTADPITLLTFVPLPGNIMTDGRYLIAHDVPLNLTTDGKDAFVSAFGASPVESGQPLFVGTGYGELEASELPLVPNLVSGLENH
jgi:hypothetical protein